MVESEGRLGMVSLYSCCKGDVACSFGGSRGTVLVESRHVQELTETN